MAAGADGWLLLAGDVSERARRRVMGGGGGGGGGEIQGQMKVRKGRSVGVCAAGSAHPHAHVKS